MASAAWLAMAAWRGVAGNAYQGEKRVRNQRGMQISISTWQRASARQRKWLYQHQHRVMQQA